MAQGCKLPALQAVFSSWPGIVPANPHGQQWRQFMVIVYLSHLNLHQEVVRRNFFVAFYADPVPHGETGGCFHSLSQNAWQCPAKGLLILLWDPICDIFKHGQVIFLVMYT